MMWFHVTKQVIGLTQAGVYLEILDVLALIIYLVVS